MSSVRSLNGPPLRSLSERIGVSRLARLTNLDRTGLEVAGAIRPAGHVLQVCNGKGVTWAAAAQGALMEAAELWAAESPDEGRVLHASAAALQRKYGSDALLGPRQWNGDDALQVPELWEENVVLGWVQGRDVVHGHDVFVPACVVHCPPSERAWLGPQPLRWTSNGMGAHEDPQSALRHALLEVLERDALARAFPEGFTAKGLQARRVSPQVLCRTAPALERWRRILGERRFDVHFVDAGPSRGGLPVVAAILEDLEGGPIPITVGYACDSSFTPAAVRALGEAAQSRLTDIQGVREDVAPMEEGDVEALRAMLHRPTSGRRGVPRATPIRSPRAIAQSLKRRVIAVQMQVEMISVVKVVVPGLMLSELL
jgi:ribosomal protein S12 methylthiotransferase accessory factor